MRSRRLAAERMLACLRRSSARLAVRFTGGSAPERLYDVAATEPAAMPSIGIILIGSVTTTASSPVTAHAAISAWHSGGGAIVFASLPATSGRYPQELKTRRSLRACTK